VYRPYETFKFVFELHNLPSAFPLDAEFRDASSHIETLNKRVQNANLQSYTKQLRNKGLIASPPDDSSSSPYDDMSTVRKLSDAGYEVLRPPKIPGCTPLFPVGSFL